MMPLDLLQDGIVTLVAVGAGGVILRRVFGFMRPATKSACGSCAAGKSSCATDAATPTTTRAPGTPATHPMVLIRR
jgi:hypothetical protein